MANPISDVAVDITLAADTDYSLGVNNLTYAIGSANDYRYHIVTYSATAGQFTLASSTTNMLGVLQNRPAALREGVIRVFGFSKMVVDGTTPITNGDTLAANASGHGVKDTTAGHPVIARAYETTAVAAQIINVFVNFISI